MATTTVVIAGPEWDRVIRALDVVETTTNPKVYDTMVVNTRRHMRQAQAIVSGFELPGGMVGRRGLQRTIARGLGLVSSRGITANNLRIITTVPESDMAIIPRGMDRTVGWRHPVFGREDIPWVRQMGGSQWFTGPMSQAETTIREGIHAALEEQANIVGAAG